MGPGPLDLHPRVYRALLTPVIGHLDPAYMKTLDAIREGLRTVFDTKNALTQATPGTGTSGMEFCVANLLGPGDRALVCVQGYFGDRIRQMAERQEADITLIESEWGRPTDAERVEKALKAGPFKVMTLVHAETSTGVLQPMDEIAKLAKEHGVMMLLDTVTSLGGVEVKVDAWGVDAAYSCSQKCIGSPPRPGPGHAEPAGGGIDHQAQAPGAELVPGRSPLGHLLDRQGLSPYELQHAQLRSSRGFVARRRGGSLQSSAEASP